MSASVMETPTERPSLEHERSRITGEYRRRELASDDLYAPWQPAEMFIRYERKRVSATMLHEAKVFPQPGMRCLEIGYGRLGWLGELLSWGMRCEDLHGLELDAKRAEVARQAFPNAHLFVGDASAIPWQANHFSLVVVSTVFTSILDQRMRELVAAEITRVLAPGGALLWYDFAVNNPWNQQVRRVTRHELQQLFPELTGRVQSVTLAPPLTRRVVPWSWLAAQALESIPCLRTHLLAVLKKPQ